MTDTTTSVSTGAVVEKAPRKRFSFGPVWTAAVLEGKIKDHEKLIAHAVHTKLLAKSDAAKLKFETLLAKLQAHISSGAAAAATAEAKTTTAPAAETVADDSDITGDLDAAIAGETTTA